jgi:HEPN domain-containing protein
MDEMRRKQVEEWFERGKHDIETAKLLYKEQVIPMLSLIVFTKQ